MKKKIIVGLGTGRCGTTTLANLLDMQENTSCLHEPLKYIPTHKFSEAASKKIVANYMQRKAPISGTIALNYLSYLNSIFDTFNDVHVLVMKREKKEVIESYLKKVKHKNSNANHWMKHNGKKWKRHRWDQCFPTFKVNNIQEAIGMYWDYYYEQIEKKSKEIGFNYQLIPIEFLNNKSEMIKVFKNIGYKRPKYNQIKLNSTINVK